MNEPAAANSDDKTMAVIAHVSGIFLGFIVPLIFWLMNKDKPEKAWLNEQSKEALNFQITVAIGYVISAVLTMILIGMLTGMAIWVANLVLCIIAAMKTNEGIDYRYPFALRLIK